ncbi:MAG: DUF3108 domain-containing protein [Acidobacteriota bacterium]
MTRKFLTLALLVHLASGIVAQAVSLRIPRSSRFQGEAQSDRIKDSAQAVIEKVSVKAPLIDHPLPFKVGESLVYEASFSKLIFSGTIGELRLTVSRIDEAQNVEEKPVGLIEFKADIVSKGFFPALFGIKIRDQFITEVSAQDFALRTSFQLIEEGKNKREQKAVINVETGRVLYTEKNLLNKTAQPKVKEADSPPWVLDLLSAIYYLRTQKLEQGKIILVPVSEGGQVYNVEAEVLGREEVKVAAGKFRAVKLDIKAFDGRYTRRKGEMKMWITDDERRLPVRAKIKSSGATVTIDLKRLPGQDKPQTKKS